MGILFVCEENKAKLPYRFMVTGTSIFTAEELFYYIYHNFFLLTDELYDEIFLTWLEQELQLSEKAAGIREMKKSFSGYDALIEAASILLSAVNIYTPDEVKEFLIRQRERKNVSPSELALKRAESFLGHNRYYEAGRIYETLLAGDVMNAVVKEEAGRLWHNLGVCKLYTEGFKEAAKHFKRAYEMTGEEVSKRQYLICCILCEEESSLQSGEGIEEAYIEDIRKDIQNSIIQYNTSTEYQKLEELKELKGSGNLVEFVQGVKELIEAYKKEFRSEF